MDVNDKEIEEMQDSTTTAEHITPGENTGDADTKNLNLDEEDKQNTEANDLKEVKRDNSKIKVLEVKEKNQKVNDTENVIHVRETREYDTQNTNVDEFKEGEKDSSKYIKNIKAQKLQETYQKVKDTKNVLDIRETKENGADEGEIIEKISEQEAESRFLLWYNDIREREEWNERRIKELESSQERYKQTIETLKENDRKLQQRYAEALIEIKALRKKNISGKDDDAFLESYKSLSVERDKLAKAAREQNHIIKGLKKDIFLMRARRSLEYAQRLKMRKTQLRTTTEHVMKLTRITKLAETSDGPPRNLVKTRNVERHTVLSEKNVVETNFDSVQSSNKKVPRKEGNRWEKVVDTTVKTKKEEKKTKPSVYLPDIRAKPGHVTWKW